MNYNFKQIEEKWQNIWEKKQIFEVKNPNYFVLSMWPYPSGKLHMGHLRNYLIGDVIARFKTLEGFKVLHPMGFDAFGLPAENAAIEGGVHPREWTLQNISQMKDELKKIGFSFDFSKEEVSCLPSYYKHEQKMFLDFFKNGIAYKKDAIVNWDPIDNTVLANEQVIDGRGWRSGAIVEKRQLSQWFLKISAFSQDLLDGIKELKGWPEKVRLMQENWIGKSSGSEVDFKVEGTLETITIFTTRPETLFGASFLAVSYAHPFALNIKEAQDFIEECKLGSTKTEDIETAEKKGFFTGHYAVNPINEERVPIYIANFVLMDYGTGALFGCPAHDERDYEFAIKYNLPIKQVISALEPSKANSFVGGCYNGMMINSGFLNNLTVKEAKEKMLTKFGEKVNFRLKDWGVSRQRYWGCPIPIINCPKCGSVPASTLPVTLPEDVKFEVGENPLKTHPTWRFTNCPECGGDAEKESDTLDTFFESSWYFLRFSGSGGSENAFINPIPVNYYVGGVEHAILHLLYARFFNRALKKVGYPIEFDEPFTNLLTQGMVCHKTYQTLDGKWITPKDALNLDASLVKVGASIKMSKSKKNVIEPSEIVEKFGADTARFFMASDNPPERDMEWSEDGVLSSHKFLSKFFTFASSFKGVKDIKTTDLKESEEGRMFFKALSSCLLNLKDASLNKAIANIREMCNVAFTCKNLEECRLYIKNILICISVFTPHVASELWELLEFKEQINSKLPEVLTFADEKIKISVQINGKLRGVLEVQNDATEADILALIHQNEAISKHLEGKKILKQIYIKNKIFSFVIDA
jgi:leucyl-tRNA synthetase